MFGKFVTGKLNRAFGKGKKVTVSIGLVAVLLAAVACQSPAQTVEIPVTKNVNWDLLRKVTNKESYDSLLRYNEALVGRRVYYKAQIIQVLEGGDGKYQLRAYVTEGEYFWDDAVFLRYSGERLLEDDIIEFVGEVNGLVTYEAVLGNKITIPEITVIHSRRIP